MRQCFGATVAIVLGFAAMPSSAWAYDVHVYRGVAKEPNGPAILSKPQFTFKNGVISTFDAAHLNSINQACRFRFKITNLDRAQPQPNDRGDVDGLPNFTATFDNNPAGHWSIAKPQNLNPTKAAEAVSTYAKNHRGDVSDGNQGGC